MMQSTKARSAASKMMQFGGTPATIGNLSNTYNAFVPMSSPGVASLNWSHRVVLRAKSFGLLSQRRQASGEASPINGDLGHTALHELHISNGGTMVPFGGYSMPVQYSDLGVGESHRWTREKASLFDVGHM